MDIYGRMFQYALIREEAAAALQGHFTFFSSELDGRLVFLVVFHYGLMPAHREVLLEQLSRHCRSISETCREKYDMDVMVYMSGVFDRPEDISSRYHKLLNTATLHRYINRKHDDPVYSLLAPDPGDQSPLRLDIVPIGRRIANAIAKNEDHRATITEVLQELENAPFQSVDELKARFGALTEVLCRELQLRGFRLDMGKLQRDIQAIIMDGNEWAEPVAWLFRFAETVSEKRRLTEQAYSHRYFEQAEKLIRENLADPSLSERSIAESLGISVSYLTFLFRRQSQKTPTSFIRELRLMQASELLRTSDMTIREISAACGFGSAETFHRTFKNEFGMPPGKLRELSHRST